MNKIVKSSLLAGLGLTAGAVFASSASADTVVKVESGDTLNAIASQFGSTASEIGARNNIKDINLIYVGDVLIIPGGSSVSPTVTVPDSSSDSSTSVSTTSNNQVSTTATAVSGGNDAQYAANKIANATGVSASTWSWIIQRESGGNAQISNASSGAFGLFQLLGHGEYVGMSVDEQISKAIQVYNAQGLSAWSVTH